MKPIKLIISSFGPYAGLMPEINFEKFKEQGLFLITGDTGAGKTMIFDAICFALYGETSGTYRDKEHLRSEYADPSQKSYVDFYFSHQGRNYHVYREPAYEREKQRGEGLIKEKEKAILYEEGKAPEEKITNVNTKIKELLKIDDKQFKQIAMIAQGEFWDLINANTERRTQILRTIFNTSGYKDMESRLMLRMKKNETEAGDVRKSIVQYFLDVTADPQDENNEVLTDLQNKARITESAWNIDEMIAAIDTIVESDMARQADVEAELKKAEETLKKNNDSLATAATNNGFIERVEKLQKEQEKLLERKTEMLDAETLLNRQKSASREVNPTYVTWKKKNEEVASTEKQISKKLEEKGKAEKKTEESKLSLAEAEKQRPELERLKKLSDKIGEEEPKYKQRDELILSLKKLEETAKKDKETEAEITVEEKELNARITELQKIVADNGNKPVELEKVRAEGKELKSSSEDIKGILNSGVKERSKRQKALMNKQEVFKKAFDDYEQMNAERIQAEKIFEGNKAGILAKDLQEGQACPVCGSTHHPNLAVISDTDISEEQLEEFKEKESVAQEKKASANLAAEKAKTLLEEYEEQMRGSILDVLTGSPFEKDSAGKDLEELLIMLGEADKGLDEKLKNIMALEIELAKKCELYDKARKELELATGDKKRELDNRKQKLSESKNSTETAMAETSAVLNTLATLSYENWAKASEEKKKIDKNITEINKTLEEAALAKTNAEKEYASVEASLKTLNDTLSSQKIDEDQYKAAFEKKLAELKFDTVEEMKSFVVSEEELSETEKKINDYKQEAATVKTQLQQAKEDAKDRKIIDLEALKTLCAEQDKAVNEIRVLSNKINNRISINKEKRTNIANQKSGFEKSLKEYNLCKRLYDLARGTSGNGKITLEQYIQAAGFDGIIAAANRRLLPMSDGQFELRRKDSLGKRSSNFLDLEVMDYHTGHKKPVGNLSGGESFKASLSLALGLSDTVSSSKGGVQMDALFVDEGFGTLDKKSMDSTIETLENLTGANKLVGVISHREELIESIPESQQIKVIKTAKGSQLKFGE